MRRVMQLLTVALMASSASVAGAQTLELTREGVARRAVEVSAEVRAARAELEAARSVRQAAGRWLRENPQLELEAGRRRTAEGAVAEVGASLSQPVELGGQRGARIEQAETEVRAAQARLEAARTEAAADAQAALVELLAARAEVEVAQEAVELSSRLLEAARARFESGDATRLDVNAQIVERGHAARELTDARRRAEAAAAALRGALALPPEEALQPRFTLLEFVHALPPMPDLQTALTRSADQPALRAARREVEAARSSRTVASREAIPSPALGVTFLREGDEQLVGGTLGVSLPLFARNDAERSAATARIAQAEAALEVQERRVALEVRERVRRLEDAQALARSYETELLAAASESSLLVEEAFRAGKMGLTEVLLIQRNALETRTGFLSSLQEVALAHLALQRAVGADAIGR